MQRRSFSSMVLATIMVLAFQAPAYGPILCPLHGHEEMDHTPEQSQVMDAHAGMMECHLAGGCGTPNVGPVSSDAGRTYAPVSFVTSGPVSSHDSQASFSPRPPPPKL